MGQEEPRDTGARSRTDSQSPWVATGRYMGHGLTLALSVLLFLLLGWWLDERLGTAPLLLLLGALVGAAAGFYSLYHHIVEETRLRDDERHEQDQPET